MKLIDANVLTKEFLQWLIPQGFEESERDYWQNEIMWQIIDTIDDQPTVDTEPVVHARWIAEKDYRKVCSNCKNIYLGWFPSKYCPHCGAKMDKTKPINYAHWEDTERVFGPCNDWIHTITCSHCGSEYDFRGKYPKACPHCEAKMEKK